MPIRSRPATAPGARSRRSAGATSSSLRELLERAAAEPVDALDRLLGDAFAAGLDLAAIEAAGLDPIAPLLREIEAADGSRGGAGAAADAASLGDLRAVRLGRDRRPRRLRPLPAVARRRPGLGLPDREMYFDDGAAAVALRAAYVEHVAAQLGHVGFGRRAGGGGARVRDAARRAAPEGRGAARHRADAQPLRRGGAGHARAGSSPAATWTRLGAGAAESVNVENPRLLEGLHEVVAATAPATLRAYLTFTVVRTLADALPAHIDDEDFEFYGRRIRGQAGAARAHQARDRRDRRRPRRGARAALRRAQLPARGQAARGDDGRRRSSRRCAPRSARASG